MTKSGVQFSAQRGLSLVETLVGIAIGLFIVGMAAKLFSDYLGGNRRLLLETRVNQDLRAAADIVVRDVRRAGYWGNSLAGATWPVAASNPYGAMAPAGPASAAAVTYAYSRDSTENNIVDGNENAGFQLNNGVIEIRNGTNWQQLTDPSTLTITRFDVAPTIMSVSLGQFCTPMCAAGLAGCPVVNVRRFDILIEGHATTDANVLRQIRESVRVRNDVVPNPSCP